ncbi:MAG: hypothetical protein EXR11_07060 [Rhodospirillaceae bacterium]|nr:hypothetical protein [Rhodospirillaceae bacterium]
MFLARIAPVQVNFLGYPGTFGDDCMDYIIADSWLIPHEHREAYAEQVVYMPDTYQPNDRNRVIAPTAPSRTEMGLPETGFVFCSFNGNYKITPEIFDAWMRLLQRVPGSVLWLFKSNKSAIGNLHKEAAKRGMAPERVIFAGLADQPNHLARLRRADLLLDTLPICAHTTASDALWAGLPLVTCLGQTFAGRVAASLLAAAGLPELIARSVPEYEALALKLATDPAMLGAIKTKLAANRESCALFDTHRFRRHLEAAFVTMHERAQRGEAPTNFAVATSS